MNHTELMSTTRWQQVRWLVFDRDKGLCRICGCPGTDTHHWTYDFGFFDPRFISLVCRPCHNIWQGEDPTHLAADHPLRPKLQQVAAIARSLPEPRTRTRITERQPFPEWCEQLVPSVMRLYASYARRLHAPSSDGD